MMLFIKSPELLSLGERSDVLNCFAQVAEFYISRDSLFVLEEDQKVRLAISKLGLSSLKPFIAK
jgi:hypothetical protein